MSTIFVYYKSITTDFGGNIPNIDALDASVQSTMTGSQGIVINGDEVKFLFDHALDTSELSSLDTIVANAASATVRTDKFFIITPNIYTTTSTSYEMEVTFEYPGSAKIGNIVYISAISAILATGTYAMRIYDSTNSNTIAEVTGLSNTGLAAVSLEPIANVPVSNALFEFQMKVTSGLNASMILSSFIIYYE